VRSSRNRRGTVLAAGLALAAVGALAASGPARADEPSAQSAAIAGAVAADGSLTLTETITFAAGAVPARLEQRIDTTKQALDYRYYRYTLSDVRASADGADLAPVLSRDGDYQVIAVDTSKVTGTTVEIGYTVRGAATDGGVTQSGTGVTAISWPVLQGLSVPVDAVSGQVDAPVPVLGIDCQAGAASGLQPCQMWAAGTHDSPQPTFSHAALPAGGLVVLSITVPGAAVAVDQDLVDQWTLGRAFSAAPAPLAVALGALVLGALALWLIWRRLGRDVETTDVAPAEVARFVPIGPGQMHFEVLHAIRPGHIGTVMDERVDPVDIAATLLDLAMRGHLQIVELPPSGAHAGADWSFNRLPGRDALAPFEATLLDVVAPDGGEPVKVSALGEPVAKAIPVVQDQLYTEVVDKGWYARRPDQVRGRWHVMGAVVLAAAVVVLVVLAIVTRFGLLGLALVALAGGLFAIGQTMPRRTRAGIALVKGLHVLSMALASQPTDQIPKAQAYDEISAVLPYTVVLGGRDRWLNALAAADDDPDVPDPDDLTWYRAPSDWSISELPVAFDAFLVAVQGRLYGRG